MCYASALEPCRMTLGAASFCSRSYHACRMCIHRDYALASSAQTLYAYLQTGQHLASQTRIWECTMIALLAAAMIPSPHLFALQIVGSRFPCCCNLYPPLEAGCLCYLCHVCFLCAILVDICAEPDCSAQSHAVSRCLAAQMLRCKEQHTMKCTQPNTHEHAGSPLWHSGGNNK